MKKNLGNSLKRFFTNKNTVTFLGVIVGIIVLYFGYNYRISSDVSPVTVPIAKQAIPAKTRITNDMLTTVKIPQKELNKLNGLITQKSQIINKFVKYDTVIPANGFFYTSNVSEETTQPNFITQNMCDDCRIFTFDSSVLSDYGSYGINSIMPGDVVDIYVKARLNNENKVYHSRIISHAEVMAVRDANNNDVFTGGNINKANTYVFTFTSDIVELLSIAKTAKSQSGIEFAIVPRNKKYAQEDAETAIVSADLEKYIRSFQKVASDVEE